MPKQRDLTLDALKLFAIFMVLWGHSIQHFLSSYGYENPLFRVIYSFHMPLFMVLVGYFGTTSLNLSFKELILKKGRQLLLPTIMFGAVFVLFVEGGGIRNWLDSFWFLKSAFCCYVIYYVSFKFVKNRRFSIVISLLISQLLLMYKINQMYPCFLMGVFLNENIVLVKKSKNTLGLISAVLFFVMLLFFNGDFWYFPTKEIKKALIEYHSFDWFAIASYCYKFGYRMVIGLMGALFFFIFFEYAAAKIDKTPLGERLCTYGRETLGIYLLQTFILEIALSKILNFDEVNIWLFNFVIAPVISVIVLCICLWMIKQIRKSQVLSLLLLGTKNKH